MFFKLIALGLLFIFLIGYFKSFSPFQDKKNTEIGAAATATETKTECPVKKMFKNIKNLILRESNNQKS